MNYAIIGTVLGLVVLGGVLFLQIPEEKTPSGDLSGGVVKLYHTPTCGCCKEYIKYLEERGYRVESVVVSDPELVRIKSKEGIPNTLWSCHTFEYEGYVFEGHIPVDAIEKVISEKPQIKGIALPGMPSGSPGMGGFKKGAFAIMSFSEDGTSDVYMTI